MNEGVLETGEDAGGFRILLVDDNRAIHGDIRAILEDTVAKGSPLAEIEATLFGCPEAADDPPSFSIDDAFQGEEALEFVEKSLQENAPYALAFVDIRMPPGWDGIQTAMKIWEVDPRVQIVLCSAYSDYSQSDIFQRLGRTDKLFVLKKPFELIEILQAAYSMTEKWRAERDVEETLAKLNREIVFRNLAEQREKEARRSAELANQAKSDFLACMTHELRTPLNSMLLLTELLVENEERNLTDWQLESLQFVQGGGVELLNLVNDILDLSKVEAGEVEMVWADFNIRGCIQFMGTRFNPLLGEKGLGWWVDIDEAVPDIIRSDEQRVVQILINLISNAIKFTDKGEIGIRVSFFEDRQEAGVYEEQSCYIGIEVSDTGIGMTEEVVDQIFGSYKQADASTSQRFGGTGLGLSISKKLAEKLGGDIVVSSSPGRGSCFTFLIPRQLAVDSEEAETETEKLSEALDCPVVDSGVEEEVSVCEISVLLVDDNRLNQFATVSLLENYGVNVVSASDGCIALELLRENSRKFDIVLMDIQMPKMNGYEAVREIKGDQLMKHLPVIAVTANAMKTEREKCLSAGADDYLSKPVDSENLIERIAFWVSKSRSVANH